MPQIGDRPGHVVHVDSLAARVRIGAIARQQDAQRLVAPQHGFAAARCGAASGGAVISGVKRCNAEVSAAAVKGGGLSGDERA